MAVLLGFIIKELRSLIRPHLMSSLVRACAGLLDSFATQPVWRRNVRYPDVKNHRTKCDHRPHRRDSEVDVGAQTCLKALKTDYEMAPVSQIVPWVFTPC